MKRVGEIYQDAIEALRMSDGMIEFEEWFPGWMVDENGEFMEDEMRKTNLKVIWDKAVRTIRGGK